MFDTFKFCLKYIYVQDGLLPNLDRIPANESQAMGVPEDDTPIILSEF